MFTKPMADLMHWHQCLGYLNTQAVTQLAKGGATGIDIDSNTTHEADCIACIEGKQHKLPFKTGRMRAMHIGKLLHMDLAGPMEITSFDNKRYFLIIVDDYSRAVWTSAIASKTEVIQKLCEYVAQLENVFRVKVQALMTDSL
jgi:hypothetical protein